MVDPENVPGTLRERDRWLMWSTESHTPRRPHVGGDYSISFNDPDEWLAFEDAVAGSKVREEWGIGFVFTSDCGLYAVDIDRPFDSEGNPREWFPGLGPFAENTYIERSPSENGYHAVVEGRPPNWWYDSEIEGTHQGVEVLRNSFCTVTGDRIDDSALKVAPIDKADRWFAQTFHAIRGHLPGVDDPDQSTLDDTRGAESDSESFERELGSVAPDSFPPCVQALTERVRAGEPMNHKARFALASFLSNAGMDAAEVVEFCEVSSEFGKRTTEYQVEHIAGDYNPPSCRTMWEYGLCDGELQVDRCETIAHPLQFYEGEK